MAYDLSKILNISLGDWFALKKRELDPSNYEFVGVFAKGFINPDHSQDEHFPKHALAERVPKDALIVTNYSLTELGIMGQYFEANATAVVPKER